MKGLLPKIMIATGFFTLLGLFSIVITFAITEYNLLSKEHARLFSSKKQFPLIHCEEGPPKLVRSFSKDDPKATSVPILTYHRIVKQENISKQHYLDGVINPMIVTTENFEKQMTFLKDNKYTALTMPELYLFLTNEIEIPEKSVVLSFDDGYKDTYVEAYPVLKNHGFSAVNFIITGAVTQKKKRFNPKHNQYYSAKELKNACDVFDYQSHTYNFHRRELNEQSQEVSYLNSRSKEQIIDDIQISIHNLNNDNLAFAYPYGEYSPSTIEILKELGFKMAFTTVDRAATRDDHLYEIPRFNILASTEFNTFVEYVGD